MIAKYNRRSFLLGVPGIFLQVAGLLLADTYIELSAAPGETARWGPWCPSLVALGVLFWTAGLASYAMAKGRSSW